MQNTIWKNEAFTSRLFTNLRNWIFKGAGSKKAKERNKGFKAKNENLDGLHFSELDGKIVLAFEAKGEWNLSGGVELAKKNKQKKIWVVFIDESVGFVKVEDLNKLKWKKLK